MEINTESDISVKLNDNIVKDAIRYLPQSALFTRSMYFAQTDFGSTSNKMSTAKRSKIVGALGTNATPLNEVTS